MSGILGSDATCNTHNALQNISDYACGVTFSFKSDSFSGFKDGYAVVSLQECCDKVNAQVQRIPGNTGCEMQFCQVQESATTVTQTVQYMYATGSGTAAQTPPLSTTTSVSFGPPESLVNCMAFVYEGDLPDDVRSGIANAGNWCVARMYDDASSETETAVTAKAAPASWTTAAADPWASLQASESASKASAASATATSKSNGARSGQGSQGGGLGRILGALAFVFAGLTLSP